MGISGIEYRISRGRIKATTGVCIDALRLTAHTIILNAGVIRSGGSGRRSGRRLAFLNIFL